MPTQLDVSKVRVNPKVANLLGISSTVDIVEYVEAVKFKMAELDGWVFLEAFNNYKREVGGLEELVTFSDSSLKFDIYVIGRNKVSSMEQDYFKDDFGKWEQFLYLLLDCCKLKTAPRSTGACVGILKSTPLHHCEALILLLVKKRRED